MGESRNSNFYFALGMLVLLALLVALYAGSFAKRANVPGGGARTEPAPVISVGFTLKADPESEAEQSTPRLLFAQIIDSEPKDVFVERAILEGRPFKYLLKQAALKKCAELRAATDEQLLFEHLSDEADLHRGKAYTPGRGVVVEVSSVELDESYGFPPGWSVLPAVYINTAKEIYALRFICPPGSTLFARLRKGIWEDQLPVINLSGLFMKNYARLTSDSKEKPWVRPLLVCPEPEFPANAEPRQAMKELQEAGYGSLLPSQRIEAPGAEERLVIDNASGNNPDVVRAYGETLTNRAAQVSAAAAKLLKRLPEEHRKNASAVLLIKSAPNTPFRAADVEGALSAAGVKRVFLKKDFSK